MGYLVLGAWSPSGTAVQSHEGTLSQVGTCPGVTLDVARIDNTQLTTATIADYIL